MMQCVSGVFLWLVVFLLTAGSGQPALAAEVPATVVSVNDATHDTVLAVNGVNKWSLSGPEVQKISGRYLEEGDLVAVTADPPAAVGDVSIRIATVAGPARFFAIVISGIVLLLLATFASGWQPYLFLVGADNRVSNSKCQVVLWFGVAMSVYLATLLLRLVDSDWQLIGGIAIPANVLAMTGLSGLTFAGAKMIAVTKNNGKLPDDAPAAGEEATEGVKQKAPAPNWRTDLFFNDEDKLDFGDFQMILIVCLSVVIYVVSAYASLGSLPLQEHTSLPDVDGSLLAAFGIGQGSYLAKKAALPVGAG